MTTSSKSLYVKHDKRRHDLNTKLNAAREIYPSLVRDKSLDIDNAHEHENVSLSKSLE